MVQLPDTTWFCDILCVITVITIKIWKSTPIIQDATICSAVLKDVFLLYLHNGQLFDASSWEAKAVRGKLHRIRSSQQWQIPPPWDWMKLDCDVVVTTVTAKKTALKFLRDLTEAKWRLFIPSTSPKSHKLTKWTPILSMTPNLSEPQRPNWSSNLFSSKSQIWDVPLMVPYFLTDIWSLFGTKPFSTKQPPFWSVESLRIEAPRGLKMLSEARSSRRPRSCSAETAWTYLPNEEVHSIWKINCWYWR